MLLRDKVAIITGAASGMGRAAAVELAAQGARVVVADIDDDRAAAVVGQLHAQGADALATHTDVSNWADARSMAQAALDRWGTIDVLYNNAAATVMTNKHDRPVHELPEETWDRIVDITLKGVYLCSKACLPTMMARRSGVVINVSSIDAFLAEAGYDAYTAAKGGVTSLTRAMATYYGRYGIRVNCISPGYVITECQMDWFQNNPAAVKAAQALHLTRLGEPEDVAHMVAFLASDKAAFITGAVIPVDGGYTAFKASGAESFTRDPQT